MKKKLIVAVATSLILTSGASAAFADDGSDSGKSESSTSAEFGHGRFKLTAEQKAAFKADLDAFSAARKVIMTTFHTAMETAHDAYETAREAATTDEARSAARVSFKAAVTVAVQVKTDALKALGPKPEKPALTAEQIAAIEAYRQAVIAYKAAVEVYKDQRELIRDTFKTARENARDAFKTAREAATTDEARQVAREAYKTAIETARHAYETARIALVKPEKPVKPEFLVHAESEIKS